MTSNVAIIGGGPAGLYAARLLKLRDPDVSVVVHERTPADATTFGFGVGLTESTMTNLAAADPQTADKVREASFAGHDLRLKNGTTSVVLHGARNLAIGRARLLEVLTAQARSVGVEVRYGSKADIGNVHADVVIAADGVASSSREKLAAELGVHQRLGRTRFVWCGADFAVDSAYFAAVEDGDRLFVAHAYPYAEDRSTFLIEADETTWQAAGLAELDGRVAPGETDEASVRLLEHAFADHLQGRRLLTNRTRWGRFTDVRVDRWSHGNVVLLGDAAHTAHYTLGSGTKLALEDAIALAEALTGESSVGSAFAAYEGARRPTVERFKALALRSQAWWDSYRLRTGWRAAELAISYMTRSGNLSLTDYAREHPEIVRDALSWLGSAPTDPAALDDWVLGRQPHAPAPDRLRRVAWDEPDVWGTDADDAVASIWGSGDPLLLVGPDDPTSVNARIDLAERLRLTTGLVVGVDLPAGETSLAAGTIAARRADFVVRR